MDIFPNLHSSGVYDNIITAIDVFSKHLFAYPVTRIIASAVARVTTDILCKHTYLPITKITDIGSQFNVQVTPEFEAVLRIDQKINNETFPSNRTPRKKPCINFDTSQRCNS